MKVDVNIIKRPGVKVDVTLARGSRRGRRVTIPVRVAPYLAEQTDDSFIDELFADLPAEDAPELQDAEDTAEALSEEPEAEPEEEAAEEIPAEEPAVTEDIAEDYDPDEEELLRLIAEEEAEMAAAAAEQAQNSAQNTASEYIPQEEYAAEPEQAEPKPDSHYMSYIDRTDDGGIREVDDTHAAGQKIVCVDGESGRISRVCGFIRNNSPVEEPIPATVDDTLPEELLDMIGVEDSAGE